MTRTARIPVPATQRVAVALAAVLLAGAFAADAAAATAVKPTVTVAPAQEMLTASYTFTRYKTERNEYCTGFAITLPGGTDLSGVVACPDGSVSVAGQTVTVTFTTPVGGTKATDIPVVLTGIGNPPAGAYNAGDITFSLTDIAGIPVADQSFATGDYTIDPTPSVSLTITTPGPAQTVDFGPIDPGTPSATMDVTVGVSASGGYRIQRNLGGQAVLMGLTVVGNAAGVKPAGSGTYTDTYQLNPPWTTDPGAYTATVLYTVMLQ